MFWIRKKKKQQEEDDQTHVYPTISVALKNNIERLAFILSKSMQDVASELFMCGLDQRELVELFAPHFVGADFLYEKSWFFRNVNAPRVKQSISGPTDRITVKYLDEETAKDVHVFAVLLDVTDAKAMALVLDKAIRHPRAVEAMLQEFNSRKSFDDMVVSELKKLMTFVNKDNPFKRVSWDNKLMELVYPKPKLKHLAAYFPKEAVDRENYRWGREIEELYRGELKSAKKKAK